MRKSISGITDSDWKKLTVYVTPPVSGKGEMQVMSGTSRPLRAFFCQTFFHEKKSFPSPPNPLSLSKKAGQAAPVGRSDGMTRAKSNRRGKATRPVTVLVRVSPGQSGIFKEHCPLNGRATHPTATRFFCQTFFSTENLPLVSKGFLRGRSHLRRGSNVAPLRAFFCQTFFSTEKKVCGRSREGSR